MPNKGELRTEWEAFDRGLAIEQHRRALQEVARRFSLSARRVPPPVDLQAWLSARHPLPEHVAFLEKRYAGEPYRLTLSLLSADLEYASQEQMTARLLESAPHTARIAVPDLTIPFDMIMQAAPPALVDDRLRVVRRQVDIFGLHTARLDLREDSGRLAATLGELLRALNVDTTFEYNDDLTRARTMGESSPPGTHTSRRPGTYVLHAASTSARAAGSGGTSRGSRRSGST